MKNTKQNIKQKRLDALFYKYKVKVDIINTLTFAQGSTLMYFGYRFKNNL